MDLLDIALPVPGDTVQEATSPGDLPTVSGDESLRRWVLRLIATEPGTLLHRPEWGVGVESYVDLPILTAASRIANAIRRQVLTDRRAARCNVRAGPAAGHPGRLDVSVEIVTVDGTTVGVGTTIAIGL